MATRAGWSENHVPDGRVDFPCRSSLLSNRYLAFPGVNRPGSCAFHPRSTARKGCRYICIYVSRWLHRRVMGQGGVYLYLLGRRVGGTYTAWTPSCPCLDLNPVSSVLQPNTFHYTLWVTTVPSLRYLHNAHTYCALCCDSTFRYICLDTGSTDVQQICQTTNTRPYHIQR